MLKEIIQELQSSQGPVSVDDLGRRLGVERSALEGMIDFLVRKGRLRDDYEAMVQGMCADADCAMSCPGRSSCPQIRELPRFLSVVHHD